MSELESWMSSLFGWEVDGSHRLGPCWSVTRILLKLLSELTLCVGLTIRHAMCINVVREINGSSETVFAYIFYVKQLIINKYMFYVTKLIVNIEEFHPSKRPISEHTKFCCANRKWICRPFSKFHKTFLICASCEKLCSYYIRFVTPKQSLRQYKTTGSLLSPARLLVFVNSKCSDSVLIIFGVKIHKTICINKHIGMTNVKN